MTKVEWNFDEPMNKFGGLVPPLFAFLLAPNKNQHGNCEAGRETVWSCDVSWHGTHVSLLLGIEEGEGMSVGIEEL